MGNSLTWIDPEEVFGTATFERIWDSYDTKGRGYLHQKQVYNFLRDFVEYCGEGTLKRKEAQAFLKGVPKDSKQNISKEAFLLVFLEVAKVSTPKLKLSRTLVEGVERSKKQTLSPRDGGDILERGISKSGRGSRRSSAKDDEEKGEESASASNSQVHVSTAPSPQKPFSRRTKRRFSKKKEKDLGEEPLRLSDEALLCVDTTSEIKSHDLPIPHILGALGASIVLNFLILNSFGVGIAARILLLCIFGAIASALQRQHYYGPYPFDLSEMEQLKYLWSVGTMFVVTYFSTLVLFNLQMLAFLMISCWLSLFIGGLVAMRLSNTIKFPEPPDSSKRKGGIIATFFAAMFLAFIFVLFKGVVVFAGGAMAALTSFLVSYLLLGLIFPVGTWAEFFQILGVSTVGLIVPAAVAGAIFIIRAKGVLVLEKRSD